MDVINYLYFEVRSIVEDSTISLKIYVAKIETKKPNIATKHMSKPSVATMVETHSKQDIATIKVNNQMVIIQI
jgi:hypothetical protein